LSRNQNHLLFASASPPDVRNGCAFPFSSLYRLGCALALDLSITSTSRRWATW